MTRSNQLVLIGTLLFLGGSVTMFGWISERALWVHIFPSSTVMVFSTALCFSLAGLAFILPVFYPLWKPQIRNSLAIIILLFASLVLLENLSGASLGVDMASLHLWYGDNNPYPGRMAPNTALAFLAGGIGLLYSENRFYVRQRAFASVILAIAVLGMIGYMLLLDLAYTWYGFPRMAFTTGMGMSLFACALLLERPLENKRLKAESNIYSFLGVAVTVLVTTVLVSYGSVRALDDRNEWVERTYEIKTISDEMTILLNQARYANTRAEFDKLLSDVKEKLARLKLMIRDNAVQGKKITELEELLKKNTPLAIQELPLEVTNNSNQKMDMVFKPLTQLMRQFQSTENQLLLQRKLDYSHSTSSTIWIIVAGSTLGFAILLYAFWFLRQQNVQRSQLEDALQNANLELEHKVAERTRELEAVNQDLQAFNAHLEQRVSERTAELESFSYSISHDLRAPLRAIDGFGRMLEEDYGASLDKNGLRFLAVIRNNSQRMGQLIDDLLAFSRLGRQEISKFNLDMTALVKEVMNDALQNATPAPEIQLLPLPAAKADRALLKQVWINLVSNAIKYSSKNKQAVVEIKGEVVGGDVQYSVRDNGAGFNMEYYDKLFGVFQRLHNVDEFSGTGVGLAIVHRILARHGGRIWAESKVNEGATFFFTLPVLPEFSMGEEHD